MSDEQQIGVMRGAVGGNGASRAYLDASQPGTLSWVTNIPGRKIISKMSVVKIRENFEDLADRVSEAGGCLSVKMAELRQLVEAGRLDAGPISQIEHNLAQHGLGHTSLSRSQEDWALIFTRPSAIARVIVAAQGRGERADEDLRAAVRELAASDASLRSEQVEELDSLRATVDQIKALVSAFESPTEPERGEVQQRSTATRSTGDGRKR